MQVGDDPKKTNSKMEVRFALDPNTGGILIPPLVLAWKKGVRNCSWVEFAAGAFFLCYLRRWVYVCYFFLYFYSGGLDRLGGRAQFLWFPDTSWGHVFILLPYIGSVAEQCGTRLPFTSSVTLSIAVQCTSQLTKTIIKKNNENRWVVSCCRSLG